jgi:hypothetical protein
MRWFFDSAGQYATRAIATHHFAFPVNPLGRHLDQVISELNCLPACPLSTLRRPPRDEPTQDSGSWLFATHYHVGDFHPLPFAGFYRRFRYGRDTGHPVPPVQIRTCGTTAYGSCLGSDAETLVRIRVYYSRGWQPGSYQFLHALPCERSGFLTPPAQSL